MGDELTMSNKEIDRLKVIQNVIDRKIKRRQASELLGLCMRQIGNLCKKIRTQGNKGIIHGLRGKPSNHRLKAGLLERALEIVKERYPGFKPTHVNEKLLEQHDIKISTFSLRQGMIKEGLWKSRKQKLKHRAWRPRRSCIGMLVQLDGSDHDWFEGRGPRCVLLIYIDDATSRILYGEFVHVEDTLTLMHTTKAYLLRHGRPIAFYVDKDSIYKVNRQATIEEELRDIDPISQFRRAMEELGIQVICANSPQAKGRVERSFRTHQDRLVKELRLAGISSMEAGNKFLKDSYIPKHNEKYAVEPQDKANAHRPLLRTHHLEEVLSLRTERTVYNDYTLRFQNKFFQLLPKQPLRIRPKSKVDVEIRLDGSFHIRFKEQYLNIKTLLGRPYRPYYSALKVLRNHTKPIKPYKPPKTHPWKAPSYKRMLLDKLTADFQRRQNGGLPICPANI